MFTVTGKFKGQRVQVSWDRGKLDGDEQAVAAARQLAEKLEGVPVNWATETPSLHDHLQNPFAALAILMQVVRADKVDGDVPEVDVPPGAIQ